MILFALGAALVISQRRFVALHRGHAERLLQAQEEERAWVAREVHDDALQRLAMLLHELDGGAPSGARNGTLRAEIEDLAVVLRRLANRLHPSFLEREGLVPALRRLTDELSRKSGVHLEVLDELGRAPALTREQALAAYRIAQEALGNVIRHAEARQAIVRVRADGAALEVAIEDDGRGFAPGTRSAAGGLGLLSMAERARAEGARLAVASRVGAGTVVRLRVPLGAAA